MKQKISTDGAPKAIGPYVQAVRANGLLFLSGQIALDPVTGVLVGTTVAEQTRRTLQNIAAVLEAGGSSLVRVLRTTVYLTDMAHFPEMNEVYGTFFGEDPPARATAAVSALPKGALVEIDAIAEAG